MPPEIEQLIAELMRHAHEHELAAARAREFVPDDIDIPQELTHALRAAVASGAALGLREAASLLAELADS